MKSLLKNILLPLAPWRGGRGLRLFALLICAMTSALIMAQGVTFEPEGTTLEQASAKAKAENKLIFLDCYTTWCGPCKKMVNETFPQESVGAYMNAKFVNLKIDMESAYGAPLAKKLQVQAYPTFVIFTADAEEINRILGYHDAESFIKVLEEKSQDNSSGPLQARWKSGDRDPQFLMEYLQTLNASYKADEANDVAEAILAGKEETFAADSTLRMIFMRNITNPFAKSFTYTVQHPQPLMDAIGEYPVQMKLANVMSAYQRQLVVEGDGTATLDQEKFDRFSHLLDSLGIQNADHYRLMTLITLAEKQKDWTSYLNNIRKYMANPALDADDMQLARWTKAFTPDTDKLYKSQMQAILRKRLNEIREGKREPQTRVGNMKLSRPTDELLEMIINALDGKMPGQ